MTPERFCFDYPTRVMTLLDRMLPNAKAMDLSTTFILSLAMPMIVIPFERLNSQNHPLEDSSQVARAHAELKNLLRKRFQQTPFWNEDDRDAWCVGTVVQNLDSPSEWRGPDGKHPLVGEARTSAATTRFDDVIYPMRHAMAHGCVVYLDENGVEQPGRRVTQVAFLSEGRQGGIVQPGSRLVAVEEDALRRFLTAWCDWLRSHELGSTLRIAA